MLAARAQDRLQDATGAEPNRVVGDDAGLALDLGDRSAGGVLLEAVGLDRYRDDRGRPHVPRHPHLVVDQLRERRDGIARVAVDRLSARLVHEEQCVRRRSVQQPERDAGVERMVERALALDPQDRPVAAALVALDHQPLGCTGDEVRDHLVDRDPPPRDGNARLAGRDEHRGEPAPPGLGVELEADGHLAEDAVRPDREHGVGRDGEVRSGRHVQAVWHPAQVAELTAGQVRRGRELGVVAQEVIEAARRRARLRAHR